MKWRSEERRVGKEWKQWQTLFWGPPKSLQMVTAAMKLKDTCSLEKLWPTYQIRSVAQSCPTLCDPMNRSMPGLPVHHQLPEFTQTHVHRVSDAIQSSHPLSSPSPPAPNPSQHQSLFQWVNSSHEVAKVREFQFQHHSLHRNPRAHLLQNGLVGSPCNPRDSQDSSPTPHFKRINSSMLSFLYSPALSFFYSPALTSIHDYWKNHSFD